jgi:hypothetical protein
MKRFSASTARRQPPGVAAYRRQAAGVGVAAKALDSVEQYSKLAWYVTYLTCQ